MKNTFIITLIFFSAIVKGQKIKSIPVKSSSKQVVIYTTALGTNLKLTASDTLSFFSMGQPFETQTCIFIDTTKKFQSVLGIGGAITDASAETFAKLPVDKQQEFLNAYFNAPVDNESNCLMDEYSTHALSSSLLHAVIASSGVLNLFILFTSYS